MQLDLSQGLASVGAERRQTPLRVGVMAPGAAELTPAILRTFRNAQPQTRLMVQSLTFMEHTSAVVEHLVDVAFVHPAPQDERITADVLLREPCVIITPTASELSDADGLHLCDVLDLDYVGMPESTPQVLTDFASCAPARNGAPARWSPDRVTTGPDAVTNVAAGLGFTATLSCFTRFYRSPGIRFIPVLDAPWEASVLISRSEPPRLSRSDSAGRPRRPGIRAVRSETSSGLAPTRSLLGDVQSVDQYSGVPVMSGGLPHHPGPSHERIAHKRVPDHSFRQCLRPAG